ncbi:MAG: O-antigen ligase family protein [Chryseotalea sp.]|jgi:O-antigen ligase
MQNRFTNAMVISWQVGLLAAFPLQFFSLKLYFYTLIFASACFLATEYRKEIFTKQKFYFVSPFIIFLLVNAIGIFYSENKTQAVKEVETYSAMLVLPLLWFSLPSQKVSLLKPIGLTVIVTTLAHCIIAHLLCVKDILSQGRSLKLLFTSEDYHYVNLSYKAGIHPTYLGVLVIASLLLIWYISKNQKPVIKICTGILALYLLTFLILLLSRGPLLGLLTILFFGAVWRLRTARKRYKILGYTSIGVIIACVFLFPPLQNRFIDPVLRMIQAKSYHFDDDSLSYHIRSWICAITSNQETKTILFGHGTGDERETLNICYTQKQYHAMINSGLDAHNEYLSQYVKIGLFGLLSFLSILFVYFYEGYTQNKVVLTSYVILIAVVCLFESILHVSKGVFFISYLFPYFYLLEKENTRTTT